MNFNQRHNTQEALPENDDMDSTSLISFVNMASNIGDLTVDKKQTSGGFESPSHF
jgi:hypothetical protein